GSADTRGSRWGFDSAGQGVEGVKTVNVSLTLSTPSTPCPQIGSDWPGLAVAGGFHSSFTRRGFAFRRAVPRLQGQEPSFIAKGLATLGRMAILIIRERDDMGIHEHKVTSWSSLSSALLAKNPLCSGFC